MERPQCMLCDSRCKVAIIADDLTGAMDSGVQLARTGYRTAVAFRGSPIPLSEDLDTLAVDTDSRPLPPERARERVLEAGEAVKGSRILYKKLDSTLRGPIAAELEAALEASGRSRAVVAPAFPSNGRTSRGGVQMLRGEPVHETELANDPRTPVHEGHIPSLLAAAGLKPVATLGVEDLENPDQTRRILEENRWVVADAEVDAHLETLVRITPDPSTVLWAGSAGLACALGAVYPGPDAGAAPVPSVPVRRALAVVGSKSGVAREQRRRLSGRPGVEAVELGLPPRKEEVEASAAEAGAALDGGGHAVLYPGAGEAAAERVVEALAEVAVSLAEEELFDGLVLTGGDTAVHVARALGATGILIEEEVEPGVPVGTLIGPRPCRVVTKAGGFGDPDTLLNALNALLGEEKG